MTTKQNSVQRNKSDKKTETSRKLVVDDRNVSGNELVLKDGTIRQVYPRALVCDNDNRSTKSDLASEPHIASHGKMIELEDVGDGTEAFLEVRDLLEVITKLDDRGLTEHAVRIHDQLAVLQRIQIAGDQQEIGAALDRQEAATRNVDTMGTLEVLDRGTDGSLELNDSLTIVRNLVVDDDVELHPLIVHNTLDCREIHPQVVGVEHLELVHRLEVLNVLRRYLSDFKQADLSLVVDDGTTLDIGLGLVGKLHQELGLALDKVLQDTEIDVCTEVVNVGDEDVLFAGSDEFIEQARVLESIEDITVAGRVPLALVASGRAGYGQVTLTTNARVARLVESKDLDVVVGVLLNDTLSVVVGVEGVHENKRNVDFVLRVQMLDLPDTQVEESHSLTDLDRTLRGTRHTHGSTETTIELENNKLIQEVTALSRLGKVIVANDLIGRRGADLFPLDLLAFGLFREITAEKGEEALHLSIKDLALVRVLDLGDLTVELIAHGLGGDTSGRTLEVLERAGNALTRVPLTNPRPNRTR